MLYKVCQTDVLFYHYAGFHLMLVCTLYTSLALPCEGSFLNIIAIVILTLG